MLNGKVSWEVSWEETVTSSGGILDFSARTLRSFLDTSPSFLLVHLRTRAFTVNTKHTVHTGLEICRRKIVIMYSWTVYSAFTNIKFVDHAKCYTLDTWRICFGMDLKQWALYTRWRLNNLGFWREEASSLRDFPQSPFDTRASIVFEGTVRKMLTQAGGFGGDRCPSIDGRVDDLQA